MSRSVRIAVALLVACGAPPRPAQYPAGSDKDDGYGDLAQNSARLLTGDGRDAPLNAPHRGRRVRPESDPYGGDPYGGNDSDDDAAAIDLTAPCRINGHRCTTGPPKPRAPRYNALPGLTGTVEGTVTWRGAPPPPVTTACGSLPSPSVRVAPDRSVGGVLVYIERVDLGRALPSYGRPASVGGTITKRGCTLAPTLQVATPLPTALAVHGDATDTTLRITPPGGPPGAFELQPAGRVVIQAQPGVTRVEAADGSLGAAWVVATDSPYYAITDDAGRFRIDELAAGSYDVTFLRPPLPSVVAGVLVFGPPVVTRRAIRIDAARPARLDVALER